VLSSTPYTSKKRPRADWLNIFSRNASASTMNTMSSVLSMRVASNSRESWSACSARIRDVISRELATIPRIEGSSRWLIPMDSMTTQDPSFRAYRNRACTAEPGLARAWWKTSSTWGRSSGWTLSKALLPRSSDSS